MVIYLDTSALLKLYVEEEGRELALAAVEESERVATSTVAYAEARAALARRLREGDFTGEEHREVISDLNEDWRTYDRLGGLEPRRPSRRRSGREACLAGLRLRTFGECSAVRGEV